MSFLSQLTKTATIRHLEIYGASGDDLYKKRWQTSGTDVAVMIQPASENEIALAEGQYGMTFRLYTLSATDIRAGDRATIDSVDYLVGSVQHFNFGTQPHKLAIITKSNE